MVRKLSNGEIFTMADDLIQLKKVVKKPTQTAISNKVTPKIVDTEAKEKPASQVQAMPAPQKTSQAPLSAQQSGQFNAGTMPSNVPVRSAQTGKSLEELLPMEEEVVIKKFTPSLKNEESVVSMKTPISTILKPEKPKSALENEIFPSPASITPTLPTQQPSLPKGNGVSVSPPPNLPIGSPALPSAPQADTEKKIPPLPSAITNIPKNEPAKKLQPAPLEATKARSAPIPPTEPASPEEILNRTPEEILELNKNETPSVPIQGKPSTPTPPPKEVTQAPPLLTQKPSQRIEKSTPPPQLPPTLTKKPGKKIFTNKLIITLAAIVLLTVLLGGGLYLYLPNKGGEGQIGKDDEKISPPIDEEKFVAIPPTSLITPNFVQELIINDTNQVTLKNTLNSLDNTTYPNNSITYLPIRVKGIFIEGNAQYLDAQMFFNALNILPPINFFDVVDPSFMLYIYGSGDEERIMCQNNLISQNSCYGPRLGMVFRALENKEDELITLVNNWKDSIKTTNLETLVLNSIAQLSEGEIIFFTEEYQSTAVEGAQVVEVSYTNLLMPSYNNLQLSATSLDFAVVNNMLVIGTSKNAVFSMIDKILTE